MGEQNDRDDVEYRTPVNIAPDISVTPQDESDFSTLKFIRATLDAEIKKLETVNVFDLKENKLTIKEQIAAYQKAIDILLPIQSVVESTVNNISEKYKGDA